MINKTMNRKMSKRQKDIKSKLMAAISMLLVSSIMMVSSTYAWFTLSTAPEVTGISTAVGANGNLEMALMPESGALSDISSDSGDGNLDTKQKNVTWGNLVDLSDSSIYGLDNLKLYPSALNVSETGTSILSSPLKTPVYGADGRITVLEANTLTATYDSGFKANANKGVRAIGVSSGMSQRELDYSNALSAANDSRMTAAYLAKTALETNGNALANIAVKHGLDSGATFATAEVGKLKALIDSLDEALDQIDNAYKQYILAFAASNLTDEAGVAYEAVKPLVEASGSTTASVLTKIASLTDTTVTLPTEVSTAIGDYNDIVDAVADALKKYDSMQANEDGTYSWSAISPVVNALADSSGMTVNDFTIDEIIEDKAGFAADYMQKKTLTLTVPTGTGVFADIADQCGGYNAVVKISGIEYQSIPIETDADMVVTTTMASPYLTAVGAALSGKAFVPSGENVEKTLTEMYGYIIDLAFRTNAANSDLKLQVDAVDRIYSDQTGAETMGHGASMTFSEISEDLLDTSETATDRNHRAKSLMEAIRIVFFDPSENNTIIAKAKLDVANAVQDTNGLTAKMYLYTDNATQVYVQYPEDGAIQEGVDYYTKSTETVYEEVTGVTAENFGTYSNLYTKAADSEIYTAAGSEFVEGTTYYSANTEVTFTKTTPATNEGNLWVLTDSSELSDDNTLMALNQNEATALSVLVYLDGNLVGNDDVAYSMANSMKGTMNLQFSSSATLVPMEYKALHQGTVTPDAPAEGG